MPFDKVIDEAIANNTVDPNELPFFRVTFDDAGQFRGVRQYCLEHPDEE